MFDFDKWPPWMQGLLGVGTLFGSFAAAWLGTMKGRSSPPPLDDDHDSRVLRDGREREERRRNYAIERKLEFAEHKEVIAMTMKADRDALNLKVEQEGAALRKEIIEIRERVIGIAADVDHLKSERDTPRRPRGT